MHRTVQRRAASPHHVAFRLKDGSTSVTQPFRSNPSASKESGHTAPTCRFRSSNTNTYCVKVHRHAARRDFSGFPSYSYQYLVPLFSPPITDTPPTFNDRHGLRNVETCPSE
jgi:hypothetical protein